MFCPDANAAFKADYEQGLATCAVKELETVEPGFAAIVAPLLEMAECASKTDAGVKAQPIISKIYALQGAPGSEPYCRSLDALKTMMHRRAMLSVFGPQSSESNYQQQRVWHSILEDLEVANFELKKGLCTDVKDDIQLRRTIKAMKSIELEDIWVAGPACDKILLPQTEAEVLDFLKNDMHRLFSLLFLYDRYSKDVLIKKSEYERQISRGSKAGSPPSPEQESKNKEWDLLVLNTPAKQAGRRKSIVDQLEDDYEEFPPSSPSDRYSTVFNEQPTPTVTNSFIERLTASVDDDEDTC
ncbi:hypothetical protein BGZ73_000691 [Actinomortierella ambigua]|nr:hypothetical protein BGZ73_000691 [Actinomortierella ambigua]